MYVIQRTVLREGRDHRSTPDFIKRFFGIDLDAGVRWEHLYVNSDSHAVGLGAGQGTLELERRASLAQSSPLLQEHTPANGPAPRATTPHRAYAVCGWGAPLRLDRGKLYCRSLSRVKPGGLVAVGGGWHLPANQPQHAPVPEAANSSACVPSQVLERVLHVVENDLGSPVGASRGPSSAVLRVFVLQLCSDLG